MAANRECGCHLSASKSISALVRGCSLQKTWFPQSLASEGVTRTWNNLSVSGQGSNAATCRTCRVSLRRSELAVSSRSGSRCLQTFLTKLLRLALPLWKRVYYQMPDGPEGMYASLALDLICVVSFMSNFFQLTRWL